MKPSIIANTAVLALGPAATALAAQGREDGSGVFVWVFIAFCALIVVAQVLPAVLMALGIIKGVKKSVTEEQEVTESTK